MKWWYENEEEEMKLYKNEDLCIECKNEFFSKPYDHRDPTPGQLGYCIKCDNFLIKEKKMEFDKSRVYTALNADELKAGDKVITARCMADLKTWVEADAEPNIIELIQDETNTDRFTCKCHGSNKTYDSPLAYLVERNENCTNCGNKECRVPYGAYVAELHWCKDYEPKTEQKAEPKTDEKWCKNCGVEVCSRAGVDADVRCPAWQPKAEKHTDYNHCEEARKAYDHAMTNACPNKHYRPFRDTDELIKAWIAKRMVTYPDLCMPHIWVRQKECSKGGLLITYFGEDEVKTDMGFMTMSKLLSDYTFTDGSPCGVEE